jgi:threonine-phosphate decarboxylase
MTFGHGGNIHAVARQLNCSPADIFDMSSNINPLGPPPGLMDYLRQHLDSVSRLPEVDGRQTAEKFADYLGAPSDRLLAGNGTTQFIYAIPRVLQSKQALIIGPTYSDYTDACDRSRTARKTFLTREADAFMPDWHRLQHAARQFDTVFVCNPNNPTGVLLPNAKLHQLCSACSRTIFIIDESYMPFVPDGDQQSMIHSGLGNVLVLLSISKIFGIPGLRIGFIIGDNRHIRRFRKDLLPWSVGSLAHESVRYLSEQKNSVEAFVQKTRTLVAEQRQELHEAFKAAPEFKTYLSQTPFVLIRLPAQLTAACAWQSLAGQRVLIRNCDNFEGLADGFIRISPKTSEANRRVSEKLIALSQAQKKVQQNMEKGRLVG